MELPFCNTETFQLYLNEFSTQKPNELKVVVLDNGAFHKAKRLVVPDNIILIFLPPFSPELNPSEKMWAKFKRPFTNTVYKTLNHVSKFITEQVQNLKKEETKRTCAFDYIFSNPFWTIR